MTYSSMKKLITNQNNKYNKGMVDADSYNMWKSSTMNKLDIFLTCDRISQAQYEELVGLLLEV